jgi:hypothetical protein
MSRLSSNITRRVVGGSTLNQPGAELRKVQQAGQQPLLQRAVVVEVFGNPGSLTEEQRERLAEQVSNPEFIDVLPGNSILARLVNDSSDLGSPNSTLLFPFFSSHIQLPIAPGEHVFVVYDDPSRSGTVVGYWLSKTSEQRTVEDVNYTVSDRRFETRFNPQLRTTSERNEDNEDTTPGFPNGGNSDGTYTLRVTGSNNQNPYDGIVRESEAIKNFTFEPVPRFNKRPGELVIQGKNNATIVFGEDRIGPMIRAETDAIGQAGCVDIVAGRGRVLPESDSEDPEETAPRVITNSRDQREVNKAPYLNEGRQDNPREGDPDPALDAARVLVTMQSEVDKNFGITELPFPTDTLKPVQPNDGTPGTIGKSYVLAKADHVRLVARKDDNVDGTVLVIRESDSEDSIAYLYIDKDGKMQLFAPEMYLGKATGKAEPYIKWSEYKKSVNELQKQIDELKTFCDNLITDLSTAFGGAIAVPYSPITSLTQQVIQLTARKTALTTGLQQPKQNTADAVENAKSETIFGE